MWVQFKYLYYFHKFVLIFTQKDTRSRLFREQPTSHLIIIMPFLSVHKLESGVSWTNNFTSGFFTVKTMSKGWRDGGYGFAITNKQHTPNRNLKVCLIEGSICKIYACKSPWLVIYHLLYFITITTSWPKETSKPTSFHDKQLPKTSLTPQR